MSISGFLLERSDKNNIPSAKLLICEELPGKIIIGSVVFFFNSETVWSIFPSVIRLPPTKKKFAFAFEAFSHKALIWSGNDYFEGLDSYRQTFSFTPRRSKSEITSANIIGVLEGKSKKDEYVIISAHYDHLGMKKSGEDKIYNGANDDASGVTGVLALAEYFKKVGNERTIVFAAFTAEEMGLIGSTHFGKGIDASKFVAGINLEMIGKTPTSGPNTAWLTGFERSDFGKIVQKNLKGSGYQLFADPYLKFNLFFRSDNASLARLGVPSHTFSTTAIDKDKDYHQLSDEAETLNMTVITQTIQAVAKGTKSIINGKDTPTRVVIVEKKK